MAVREGELALQAERLIDGTPDVSLREFLTRIYIRPRIFWSCVIIPPLLAIFLTFFVPTTWKATVEILIRYSSDESPFLKGLIPAHRELLSGEASAEILQSIPTLVETIRHQDITANDIYQKPTDVLSGYVANLLGQYFPTRMPPGLPGIDPKTLILAQMFQNSLANAKSGFLGSSSSKEKVKVLQSSSNIPSTMKTDELLTVTVPSFNRTKVAQMANGLAQAFIDQYYRISTSDATAAYAFLSTLVDRAQQNYDALVSGRATASTMAVEPGGAGDPGVTDIARQSPLLENLSKQLAQAQSALAQAEGIYQPGDRQVAALAAQVSDLKGVLARETQIEIARHVLEQLKVRRYQAYNTVRMYQRRLAPIKIVEPAFTPKMKMGKVLVRYVLSGGIGLVLGIVLALCLTIVFGVTDQRVYTSWDIKRLFRLPLVGALPALDPSGPEALSAHSRALEPALTNGLLQIIGHLDTAVDPLPGRVIVMTSASEGEGKSFAALALARALAQGGKIKVLLIDAGLRDQSLTQLLAESGRPGFIESVLAQEDLGAHVHPLARDVVDFLPAGAIGRRGELGIYSAFLRAQFQALRLRYHFIVVDTVGVLNGNEAMLCSLAADDTLIVAASGVTRKPLVHAALQKLRDVGATPGGVILNRQRPILPNFLYRSV
ncbi:MAG: hypothetical protein M0037_09045 [Betaproteobacteria bacterium]|nr:hypothetical protein [Betaproteobacteria bacterium]